MSSSSTVKYVSLETIETHNRQVRVAASQILLTGLGLYAKKDFAKGETVCYYMGSVIPENETDDDDYSFRLSNNMIISPSRPLPEKENRFFSEPICKAAFFNDCTGTEYSENVSFSDKAYIVISNEQMTTMTTEETTPGGAFGIGNDDDEDSPSKSASSSPVKKKQKIPDSEKAKDPMVNVAPEKVIYAVKIKAITAIKEGQEMYIKYGNNYWSSKRKQIQKEFETNITIEKSSAPPTTDVLPVRFYHVSKIDTETLAKSALSNIQWYGVEDYFEFFKGANSSTTAIQDVVYKRWNDNFFDISTKSMLQHLDELDNNQVKSAFSTLDNFKSFLQKTLVRQEILNGIDMSVNKISPKAALFNANINVLSSLMDDLLLLLLQTRNQKTTLFLGAQDLTNILSKFQNESLYINNGADMEHGPFLDLCITITFDMLLEALMKTKANWFPKLSVMLQRTVSIWSTTKWKRATEFRRIVLSTNIPLDDFISFVNTLCKILTRLVSLTDPSTFSVDDKGERVLPETISPSKKKQGSSVSPGKVEIKGVGGEIEDDTNPLTIPSTPLSVIEKKNAKKQ